MKSDRHASCVVSGLDIDTELGRTYRQAPLVEWASVTKTVSAATALVLLARAQIQDSTPVAEVLPHLHVPGAFSIGDLIDHTSGLPRTHRGMPSGIVGDPYRDVDRSVAFGDLAVEPNSGSSAKNYSNLGYALLGEVIETVSGSSWLAACNELVLIPAGVRTATLTPRTGDRVVPRNWRGTVREPWQIGKTPYAAAGGLWSTLEDMARFGARARESNPDLRGWEHRDELIWHSGQTRDSGVCVMLTNQGAIAAHTLGRLPGSADKLAVALLHAQAGGAE